MSGTEEPYTTQEAIEKVHALLGLVAEDGSTPPGAIPTDHVRALNSLRETDPFEVERRAQEIVTAHRQGNPPPQ